MLQRAGDADTNAAGRHPDRRAEAGHAHAYTCHSHAVTDRGRGDLVELTDELKFMPDRVSIRVGDTITWRNAGSVVHTVTDDPAKAVNAADAVLPPGAQPWDSGLLAGGQSFSLRFDIPGDYVYFCIPHELQGMVGRIQVG